MRAKAALRMDYDLTSQCTASESIVGKRQIHRAPSRRARPKGHGERGRVTLAYLCFDVGSSALKSGLISAEGRLLGSARRPLILAPSAGGAYETDAGAWIEAAFSAGAETVSIAKGGHDIEVRAISVSGNGPTLLAADAAGHPLGLALSWLDRRAHAEAEEVSKLAGMAIDPSDYLPKALRFWRNAEPRLRERIRWFFSCPEYLQYALCGEAFTYLPHPGFLPYYWNEGLVESLGLPPGLFPPFISTARIAGTLLPSAGERLGLRTGIPIVSGSLDFLAAIVGSASTGIGIACDRSGSSEAINLCADRPFPSPALLSLPHPVDGLWNLSGGVSTAGSALEWLSKIVGPRAAGKKEAAIAGLLADARHSPPGARGLVFLPYLAGERAPLWDARRRAAFVGLSLELGSPDLARAAVESLAYGLKLATNLALREGIPFDLLRVSGQASGDDFLCELKADILGVPVEAPEIGDCELVGDASACALALGEASSLAEASASLLRIRRRFEPKAEEAYAKPFASYEAALAALAAVDRDR
jgi:xylulokinase